MQNESRSLRSARDKEKARGSSGRTGPSRGLRYLPSAFVFSWPALDLRGVRMGSPQPWANRALYSRGMRPSRTDAGYPSLRPRPRSTKRADAVAIARVILHEWIHIATQSPGHAPDGLGKAAFRPRDLVAHAANPAAAHHGVQ
jgi:hypothetical protein